MEDIRVNEQKIGFVESRINEVLKMKELNYDVVIVGMSVSGLYTALNLPSDKKF